MTDPPPRYLVPFHPKHQRHRFVDVLIIGGGLAGLRVALGLPARLTVLVVTKDRLDQSNSHYAQGGIAGVMDPEDRFEDHVEDTIQAGGGLCDPAAVDLVVREAPQRISELIEWGTQFDRVAGELDLGREGGHSHDRIVHALGDATGREVMRAMIEKVHQRDNIEVWQNAFTLDLLTYEETCRGAIVADESGGRTAVWSKQTVLCTGGAGQLYRETTNPAVATGDGHAAAYRAGAELRDMEFVQFHPTVLYIAGSSRTLITEAVRGAGARLVDRTGYRFMYDYDERGELAPRDVVSRAIAGQMEKTRHPNVYLDMTHLDGEKIRARFPGIARTCAEFDLDITTDSIPVRPGAHYMIGGLVVDAHGRTTLPGLWAAGEATSSGLHGANRLASNSLLEALVFGAYVAEGVTETALGQADEFRAVPLVNRSVAESPDPLDLGDIRNSLKSLMWRNVGIRRNARGLNEAVEMVDYWCRYVLTRQFAMAPGWELQNLLTIARLVITGARLRTESRGVHFRDDYPEPDDANWQRHIRFRVGELEPLLD